MENWDGKVTKLLVITVFNEKKFWSKQFSNIIVVHSFWNFLVKPKWNISKNVSMTFKLKQKKLKVSHITFFLLLVRTHNAIYKSYSFEASKLLVSCFYVKSST